jgi:aspartate kinase
MQELAESGARVLNAQAVEFAKDRGIAIYARATFQGPGETIVRKLGPDSASRVVGIASQKGLVVLELKPNASLDAVLAVLDEHGAAGKELVQRTLAASHGSLVLSLENVHAYAGVRDALYVRCGDSIRFHEGVGAVSAVGAGINASHANLRRAMEALTQLRSKPIGITTSSFRISLLVDENMVDAATRRLHDSLLDKGRG